MLNTLLSADHRHCDDHLAAAEQAAGRGDLAAARDAFTAFEKAMQAHFAAEESVLFPAFEERTGITMGPTRMMRFEHEQMRGLLGQASAALAAGDLEAYLGQAETLVILMQQHNMKEENVLYPMCEQHLAEQAAALAPQIRQVLDAA